MAQLTQGLLVWKLVLAGAGHEQQLPKAMSKVQIDVAQLGGEGGGLMNWCKCSACFTLPFVL